MKRKDKEELHSLTVEVLKKKAQEVKKLLGQSYLDGQTKEVKNRKIVKELRKRRAVILSIVRNKELT